MNEIAYSQLCALAGSPDALEETVSYVYNHFSTFLKKRERVLICFDNSPDSVGYIMEQAIVRCGAVPVFPKDLRWKTLLRESFFNHCAAIVGTPLLVLGLSKLAKRMDTPLYMRNVILAGYPCTKWMIEGIRQGLDCKIWGLFDPCVGPVIAGFSDPITNFIDIRSDVYGVDIIDEDGKQVPEGERGEIVLYPVSNPEIRFHTGDFCIMQTVMDSQVGQRVLLSDFSTVYRVNQTLSKLGETLHMWTSILDCKLIKSEFGLELEIVTFPGEKLPKLPSCAKLVVRNWDPETDIPFAHMRRLKNRHFSYKNG